MDASSLLQSLSQLEKLITRDAETFADADERRREFDRRLARMSTLADCLGNPQNAFPIIHIGGTSGKGSVAMLCEAVLGAAGLLVGTHTTPYLQTPIEKVRVDRQLISTADAIELSRKVLRCVEQLQLQKDKLGHPHYAEAWLGLAMDAFKSANVNAGIIEVGMGGQYDCTNIVVPKVSTITSVHYDHVRVLGDTIQEIARHKAGIIKHGVPVVAGEMFDEALEIVAAEAKRNDARLVQVGREVTYKGGPLSEDGGVFSYHGIRHQLDDVRIALLGSHQYANAAAALATLELFSEQTGLNIPEAAIRDGLANVQFAGRLEVMQRNPLVVLDGAHNEEKVGALAEAIPAVFKFRKLILVAGLLETKNVSPILERLAKLDAVLITTAPTVKGKPAFNSTQLAELAARAGIQTVVDGGLPHQALETALDVATQDDLIVVTGSLYLIGSIRSHWYMADQIVTHHTMFPNNVDS